MPQAWLRRSSPIRLLACLLAFAVVPEAWAWGFSAHRLVNRRAIDTLPPPLRELFEKNADYVAEHSIDPDLWRASGKPGEDPNHYLDMDAFGDPRGIPRSEPEHVRRHGAGAPAKGRVPWRVAEVYAELVRAFRDRDAAAALEHAAVLGHYLGDAHVPLHAVLNYDGQQSGQTGIHTRWEGTLFERFEAQLAPRVAPGPAVARRDPVDLTFDTLLDSFDAAAAVLASDKALAGPRDYADTPEDDRYPDSYYSALFVREEARMAARLARASQQIGALWLGAWEEAGRPAVPDFRFPYVRRGSRLVLLSIDGAAAPVIDAALTRGAMPSLARLRARGARARGSITSLPVKTPAGHAAVFTGAWSDRNGISGIEMPLPGANVLTGRSGYTSEMLRAEPIWITAARQGLDVSVVSATQTYPFAPFLEEQRFGGNYGRRLTLFDSYQNRRSAQAVFTPRDVKMHGAAEFDLGVAGVRIEARLLDDPADPATGFDSLYLAAERRAGSGVLLKPEPPGSSADAFRSLTVRTPAGDLGLQFRLFSLQPDGSDFLLYVAESALIKSNRSRLEVAALEATGGFAGNGASDLYKDGAFGPPLWMGGGGLAEARYLETAHLVERQFRRLTDFGIDRTRWDVLLAYLPFPDEQLHLWFGFLDPSLPGHDPVLARRLRPFVDQALGIADAFVGHVMSRLGDEVLLAVSSDHGMMGANRSVQFNVALHKAGLLALTPEGAVDLLRTRAVYFPGNSGYFLVNRTRRPEGIVTPEQEPAVLGELKAALRAIRDPGTGESVVASILDPRDPGHEPGIGGPSGGDLYVALRPGYYSSAALRGDVVVKQQASGEHLYSPQLPALQAAFALAGPGVLAGADLGTIRQIDIAPTLAALLGIEPPAQSQGVVLRKALLREPLAVAAR